MVWSHQFEHVVSIAIGAIGPLVAVLLGGGVTLIGVILSQRGEARRARSEHEWAVRAATAERLRELYAPYVALSNAMKDFAKGWQISLGESMEDKQSWLRENVHSAWAGADKVNARVALESGSSGAKSAADVLRTKFNIFELNLANVMQLEGVALNEQRDKATAELQAACDSMVEQAVAHIAQLEEPR